MTTVKSADVSRHKWYSVLASQACARLATHGRPLVVGVEATERFRRFFVSRAQGRSTHDTHVKRYMQLDSGQVEIVRTKKAPPQGGTEQILVKTRAQGCAPAWVLMSLSTYHARVSNDSSNVKPK